MDTKRLKNKIDDYSAQNAYLAEHFVSPSCEGCGGQRFSVLLNEEEGVAARICTGCEAEHGIGDSDEYIDEVESVSEVECSCGGLEFEIMAGVALYSDSDDVRWFSWPRMYALRSIRGLCRLEE